MRLDLKLKEIFPEKTRSQLEKLVEKGCVKVNKKIIQKSAYKIDEEDIIKVKFPEITGRDDLKPKNIPLDIIFENKDYLVINKQKGIVVHPSEDEDTLSATIVNAVLYHCGESLSGINGEKRPGIVHRLDKNTTGVLIIAKNDKFHAHLAKQIENREVKKIYRALVLGHPENGVIEAPIGRSYKDRKIMGVKKGGRYAKTVFKLVEYFPKYDVSLVEIELITGRTHQIRVHFKSINHPVVGDSTYGNEKINKLFSQKFNINSQLLHAYKYSFIDLEGHKKKFIAEIKEPLLLEENELLLI